MRYQNRKNICFLTIGAALIVLLSTQDCFAQRPVIEGAASVGSGVSFGSGDGRSVVLMTPTYLDLDIIYYNDEAPKLEYVIGFQAELQGRVSVGIVPQLRFTVGPKAVMLYGIIGAPIVFAPFVLAGVEIGSGLLWWVNDIFGLFGEVVMDLFFLGNDLQKDGMLAQLDANFGVRISF